MLRLFAWVRVTSASGKPKRRRVSVAAGWTARDPEMLWDDEKALYDAILAKAKK
jgi:hypothetical protein